MGSNSIDNQEKYYISSKLSPFQNNFKVDDIMHLDTMNSLNIALSIG